MKKQLLFTTISLLLSLSCFSQDFKISNSSKRKTINKSRVVNIVLGKVDKDGAKVNVFQTVYGRLESVTKDSVMIKASSTRLFENMDQGTKKTYYEWTGMDKTTAVSKSDIFYLSPYKSMKSKKSKRNLRTTGGLLLFTGIATAANALLVSEKKNKNVLLLSGGIQFGTGILLASIARRKKYHFKNTNDPWEFQ